MYIYIWLYIHIYIYIHIIYYDIIKLSLMIMIILHHVKSIPNIWKKMFETTNQVDIKNTSYGFHRKNWSGDQPQRIIEATKDVGFPRDPQSYGCYSWCWHFCCFCCCWGCCFCMRFCCCSRWWAGFSVSLHFAHHWISMVKDAETMRQGWKEPLKNMLVYLQHHATRVKRTFDMLVKNEL